MYLDRTFDYSWPPGVSVTDETVGTGFQDTARVVSGVVREDPANTQPEFPSTVFRFLPEDTPDYKYVGHPVTATDADTGDVLTYTLDGTDKDSFFIASSVIAANDVATPYDEQAMAGQIRVEVLTDLDHETDPSYDVEVEATDGTSTARDAFAKTAVDIYVTDVDEKPDIWVMDNRNRVRDEFEVNYEENDDRPGSYPDGQRPRRSPGHRVVAAGHSIPVCKTWAFQTLRQTMWVRLTSQTTQASASAARACSASRSRPASRTIQPADRITTP